MPEYLIIARPKEGIAYLKFIRTKKQDAVELAQQLWSEGTNKLVRITDNSQDLPTIVWEERL